MQFNEYLKSCRQKYTLTQEELVSDLYTFDIENFSGLDTSTLSKWERSITKPKVAKQVAIMKYFQKVSGYALPCIVHPSIKEAEELICRKAVHNLLGKNKQLIFNFPSELMSLDDIHIAPLRSFDRMDVLIEGNMHIQQGFSSSYVHNTREQIKEWSLHPSSTFLACEYKESFLGFFFSLKLKPKVFNKLVNFEMKKSDLTLDDFASSEEEGSQLMISFFAMNEKVAMMLTIRFFAHLIANQDTIVQIGGVSSNEEAIRITERMNLKHHASITTDDNKTVQSIKETLPNVLASEYIVKMILSNQACPEE